MVYYFLQKGFEVIALRRNIHSSVALFDSLKQVYPDVSLACFKWEFSDLKDVRELSAIFETVDVVCHSAGLISYRQRDASELIEINAGLTENVVDAALVANVKRLIYISSIAALNGASAEGQLIDEDVVFDKSLPHSKYGFSKYLGECEIFRGKEEGLKTAIINPGVILGFGNWNTGSNKLFKNAYKSFPFYSEGVTGFVGVEDVCKLTYQLSLENREDEKMRYTAVSENLSFKVVNDFMSTSFGKRKSFIEVKGVLFNIIYAAVAVKEWLGLGGMLTRETVSSSQSKRFFSNVNASEIIGKFSTIEIVVKLSAERYKQALRLK